MRAAVLSCSNGTKSRLPAPASVIDPKSDMPTKDLQVLVAEDEALVRLMVADVLREQGFHVFEAVDAEEAVAILKAVPVHAVVTDLHMRTVGDGAAVAEYVRAHCPSSSRGGTGRKTGRSWSRT